MTGAAADTRPEHGAAGAAAPEPRAEPPVGATVAVAVLLAVACFATLLPLMLIVNRPTPLPAPFEPQNQDAETLLYLLAYLAILPASLIAGRRLAGRTDTATVALLAGALGGLVGAVKLSGEIGGPDGVRTVLAAMVAWWLLAGVAFVRPPRLPPHAATAVAAAGIGAGVLALTDLDSLSATALVLGAIVAAAAVAAYGRVRVPRLAGPWATALEVAVVALLLLAVPDLVIFRPEDAPGSGPVSVETAIIVLHQNLLLGPANQVLGGAPLLIDTATQYGVGDVYAIAGWFLLAPIGYGTFGLLDGIWTAAWFLGGYGLLRIAGATRMLAVCALGIAVVALVFNLTYSVGALPQYGPLRFGFPLAAILAVVAAERWPRHARAAQLAALAVAGASALWSLEALAYTTAVLAALTAMRAWLRETPGRLRWLARQAAWLALAWTCAHVLFALATLAAWGELPDWGQYLDYLDAFLFGPVGDLTYDVPHWSPGLALGAAYAASAAALVELARRRHELFRRERPALIALTGLTAYGIVLLSYWVDRSLEHILVHIALPGLLLVALWLSVLLRSAMAPRIALAGALAVAVLVLASAWPAAGDRFPRSALAHAAPGGDSLPDALERLWDEPPAMNRAAQRGERVLERHIPGEDRSLVFASPDVAVEIYLRSRRIDKLLLGDTRETSFVAEQQLPALRRRLAELRAGDRMLMDAAALESLRTLRADPDADPLQTPGRLVPVQQFALERIDERFRLRTIAREQGFEVMELAALRP